MNKLTQSQTERIKAKAPFDMPPIPFPCFEGMPVFNIVDYGAIEGTSVAAKIANNQAIEQAIQLASEQEGGTVMVPEGTWLCAKIHFKSFVNLHVARNATLLFSGEPEDYLPSVPSSWEGMECYNYSPLIYAYNCRYIGISGQGKLKVLMHTWHEWGGRPKAHMDALADLYHQAAKYQPVEQRQMAYDGANLRPQFVQFNRCEHVLVEDISIEDSPFWVLHPFLSKDLVFRRVKVSAHGHNSDGVDPEMTQNMLIEDCVFNQGDDAIALKSGRNQDGWRLNVPTKNIVIRRCHIQRAHHLIAIGSELSAGIENILIENCKFDAQTDYQDAGNLLYIKTNERCGGFVKHIYMQNIEAASLAGAPLVIETDVLYQWRDLVPTYERRLTQIEQIHIDQVTVGVSSHLCRLEGQKQAPIKCISLNNVAINFISGARVLNQNVEGFIVN